MNAESIELAAQKIKGALRRTPIVRSEILERKLQSKFPIYFKLENLQHTGSFKSRGALLKLLSVETEARQQGVITASAGNHAQGVAYHCFRLGLQAKIVMPEGTPLVKVNSTRQWGAEVVFSGDSYQEAYEHALTLQKAENRVYIHAFDDESIIAGQGTVALEVLEDVPDLKTFFCPIGGGGLLAGCALYLPEKKSDVRIVGIQAEGASCYLPSLKAGKPIALAEVSTLAEGIAVKRMGDLPFSILQNRVRDVVLASDQEIAAGILWLLENERIFVEGCGGAAVAALFKRPDLIEGPTAVVLTGGNLDVNLLARIIERGLVNTGRLVLLEVSIPDKPGSLYKLIQVFAELKASIVQISHERVFESASLRDVATTISLETQGPDHVERIKSTLRAKGWEAKFH
jgi:threonine dehydratase